MAGRGSQLRPLLRTSHLSAGKFSGSVGFWCPVRMRSGRYAGSRSLRHPGRRSEPLHGPDEGQPLLRDDFYRLFHGLYRLCSEHPRHRPECKRRGDWCADDSGPRAALHKLHAGYHLWRHQLRHHPICAGGIDIHGNGTWHRRCLECGYAAVGHSQESGCHVQSPSRYRPGSFDWLHRLFHPV